jgi:hypothetical protein
MASHDYTHTLPIGFPNLRLVVDVDEGRRPNQPYRMSAILYRGQGDNSIGSVDAHVYRDSRGLRLHIYEADLHKPMRGLGLGKAMYVALITEGQKLGVNRVTGQNPSESAQHVHRSLARLLKSRVRHRWAGTDPDTEDMADLHYTIKIPAEKK